MNPNVVDEYGDTPADKAAENGHEEALKLLLKVREGSAWGMPGGGGTSGFRRGPCICNILQQYVILYYEFLGPPLEGFMKVRTRSGTYTPYHHPNRREIPKPQRRTIMPEGRVLGGSWVVISGVISPLICVVIIITLLMTPLT